MKENGLENTITIIKGKVEEVKLPVDKVDIIISEWMGYFLLYESMLDTVLYARDKYLVPGGLMLPDKVCLRMVAIEDSKYRGEKYGFWDDVYGVKMESIKNVALGEPLVDVVERPLITSDTCTFFQLDLYTAKVSDLDFANKYVLNFNRSDMVHALTCWFDAYFSRMKEPVVLSTSPYSKTTHWRQTVFYLGQPFRAKAGEALTGTIAVRKSVAHFRDLDITISFHYKDQDTTINNKQMYKLK